MTITFQPDGGAVFTLATDTRGMNKWVGPDNPRLNGKRLIQELNPVGAARASLHERKNRTGVLSFSAKCTCADAAAAIALALGYDDSLPAARGTLAYGAITKTGAIIESVDTYNVGVTVYANLVIRF